MARETYTKEKFVTILGSDGTFRESVPEGTTGENIEVRVYKDDAGVEHTKTEIKFNKMTGKITGIGFREGQYGQNIQISITDDAGTEVISLSTSQTYGEDFMKKLPNIDLSKEVSLSPFCFPSEKDATKMVKGITIKQGDVKVEDFFKDKIVGENGKYSYSYKHGFPEVEGDPSKMSKQEKTMFWKNYFFKAEMFLINYIKANFSAIERTIEKKEDTVESVVDEMLKA